MKYILVLLVSGFGLSATAALPSLQPKDLVSLPLGSRAATTRKLGPDAYQKWVKIMFSKKESMESRWAAVMTVAKVGGKNALPEIEKALIDKEWFMRNAGLLAISHVDVERAKVWSRKLLSDKALLVRSAAVRVLTHLNDQSSVDLLWEKLQAPENFRHGQSLFIRKQIVHSLGKLERKGQETRFLNLLKSADASMHAPTIEALETLTQKKIGKLNEDPSKRRAQWLKYLSARRG